MEPGYDCPQPIFAKRARVEKAGEVAPEAPAYDFVEVLHPRLRRVCYYDGHPFDGPGVPWPMSYHSGSQTLDMSKVTKWFCSIAAAKAFLLTSRHAHFGFVFAQLAEYASREFGFTVTPPAAPLRRFLADFCQDDAMPVDTFRRYGDYYILAGQPELALCANLYTLVAPPLPVTPIYPTQGVTHLKAVCFHDTYEFEFTGVPWPLDAKTPFMQFCSIACLLAWFFQERNQARGLVLEAISKYSLDHFGTNILPAVALDRTVLDKFAHNGLTIHRFRSLGDYYLNQDRPTCDPPRQLPNSVKFAARLRANTPQLEVDVLAHTSGHVAAVMKQPNLQVGGMFLSPQTPANQSSDSIRDVIAQLKTGHLTSLDVAQNSADLQRVGPPSRYRVNGVNVIAYPREPRAHVSVRLFLLFLCCLLLRFVQFL